VRDAVRGLTGRGRGLLAVGVLVAVGAWVFGQRDLLRVAVLLLALPLLSTRRWSAASAADSEPAHAEPRNR